MGGSPASQATARAAAAAADAPSVDSPHGDMVVAPRTAHVIAWALGAATPAARSAGVLHVQMLVLALALALVLGGGGWRFGYYL